MIKTNAHSSLLAERLSRSEIFSDICLEDRLAIAKLSIEETYDEGESLLIESEAAEKLFVIERGKVSLDKRVQLGRHSTPPSGVSTAEHNNWAPPVVPPCHGTAGRVPA